MIYLDTHVVVWMYGGMKEKLSKKATIYINEEFIAISPIVELELQYLYEIDKISVQPEKVLDTLYKEVGLTIVTSDTLNLVKQAKELSWTRNPFDRLITAQAILDNSKLITRDQVILRNFENAKWN